MKIFWSWQSDHRGNISRHLVRKALELAVASLNEELSVEEPEREALVDHDRKGVPGSPDLANIILEKIRNSDVFVADVTPVGRTGNEPPKKLMNPNVAIELGYALHTITDRRMILVMNTSYGTRADLPFDLQHKAGPILYTLPPDATKEQINKAKKQLIGDLKFALRDILPSLGTGTATFQKFVARPTDPARYYAPNEALFTRRGILEGTETQSFTVAETPIIYLRIMPTTKTKQLKRVDAYDLVRQGPNYLNPFYHGLGGSSFESNGFGAIAFDANYEKAEILYAAQLFLNREIWAFNTIFLSSELARSSRGSLGVPTLAVEKTFAICLPEYARFMNDKLGVPLPYCIEAGAFGVKDYVLFMPSNYLEKEWGPVHQNHVCWSGTIQSLKATDLDAALLKIFEAFFDAGACARPTKLYDFPGDPPGTLPRG